MQSHSRPGEFAKNYDKNNVPYIIAGIASFYGSSFLFGVIIGFVYLVFFPESISIDGDIAGMSEKALGFIALPFGLLACYLLHRFLSKKWEKEKQESQPNIDDIGMDRDYLNQGEDEVMD